MKLCINCKHCKKETFYGDIYEDVYFYCEKGSTQYKDPITGEMRYRVHSLAYDCRNDIQKCGTDAKWFEERTGLKYKIIKWLEGSK